jgi:hypothetical protein
MTIRTRESSPLGGPASVSVVKDAILVLMRRLSKLPGSAQRDLLMEKGKKQLVEVDAWELSPSGGERRNELMKRTLELHFEVVGLERGDTTRSRPTRL